MSYQMIHMEIAYRVAEKLQIGDGRAEFVLGSVAPDAVHFRDDYRIKQKIHSHLFEGCGPWGDTQDYERWIENMEDFWRRFGEGESDVGRRMFIFGMYVHCLTDYYNDRLVWRELQKMHIPPMTHEAFREAFYPEARAIDRWLYQTSGHTGEIRRLMKEAKVVEVPGYVSKEEIGRMREHLLKVQYAGPRVEPESFKYYTRERLEEFLERVTEKIFDVM